MAGDGEVASTAQSLLNLQSSRNPLLSESSPNSEAPPAEEIIDLKRQLFTSIRRSQLILSETEDPSSERVITSYESDVTLLFGRSAEDADNCHMAEILRAIAAARMPFAVRNDS
jgi:hypothetical protein